MLLLGCALPSLGQEASASLSTEIKGTVTDPSGALASNASVSLTSNVSPTQTLVTDASGTYSFKGLRAGTYKVMVSLSGFNDYESVPIPVEPGHVATLDVKLEVSGTQTKIEVSGDAPHVEIADPTVSSTLESAQIAATPLNGRNFLQLIALAPGVSNQTGQDEARVGVQGSASYSVNGGRTEYNSYELDGSDLLNVGFNAGINTLVVYPSLDAIGEMKILTSNYGAMYGRTASGIVSVSTKAGTSSFHGDLYYYNRNEAFNARNFFDQTKGAPLYRRHDLGGTLGGPVFIPGLYNTSKEKTFFFFSEEYRNEKTPTQFQQAVPTAAERNGDFTAVCPTTTTSATSALRAQFPLCPYAVNTNSFYPLLFQNASIPTITNGNYFPSRNAAAILSTGIIPLPNSTVGCNSPQASCYVTTVSEPTHWREELFRIDHYFNEKNRLTFRYTHDSWDTITPTPQYGVIQNTVPTVQNNFTGPGLSVIGRFSETLSPTLLNEVFVGYVNSNIKLTDRNGVNGATYQRPSSLDAPCSTAMYPTVTGDNVSQPQCPIGYIFPNASNGKVPAVEFQGDPLFGGGVVGFDPGYMPWSHTNPIYTFGDSMSKQLGKHFLQFGSEFVLSYRRQTNSVTGTATGDTQGILTYSGQNPFTPFSTFLTEFPPVINTGQNPAYTLNGPPVTFVQDSGQAVYHQRYEIAEPYLQDDWKVTPRLTVNLGLRLSLFGRYSEENDNAYNWIANDYNPVLASQVIVTSAGLISSTPFAGGTNPATGATNAVVPFVASNPPPVLLNGVVRCGYDGVPSGCMKSHVFNPAPRVGFAWDVFGDGKTSLRAGYGVFFEHGTGAESNTGALEGAPPLVYNATTTGRDISCFGNPLPECNEPNSQSNVQAAQPLNLTHIQTKGVWPYVQQWSLSLQRQFPSNIVASIAFVGSKGTHLTAELDNNDLQAVSSSANPYASNQPFNASTDCRNGIASSQTSFGTPIVPGTDAFNRINILCGEAAGTGTAGSLINPLRPYYAIGQILSIQNIANSAYRSFQATINKRTGPLVMGLSYTYGYSYDSSSDRYDPIPDAYNLHANWAPSNFDQRHLLNITYTYNLPFLYLTGMSSAGGFVKQALDGWQLGGITVFQSGQPFSVINEVLPDNAAVGSGLGVASLDIGSYPDLVGYVNSKPTVQNVQGVYGPLLYNPSAYQAPQGLTFGNAGRNSLRNPDRWNFDMSLFKNFNVGGERSVQFRAEAFNVFNNTQFELFNPAKGNQANNEISCYGGSTESAGAASCLTGSSFLRPIDAHRPRTLQVALKFVF